MKFLRFLIAGLLATGGIANASEAGPGMVHALYVMNNGTVLFHLTGSRTSMPACATMAGRWAFDGTTPAGQAKLAFLLSAYAAQKSIVIYGANACPDWGDTETVNYFHTAD